jgi:hypothetical protein
MTQKLRMNFAAILLFLPLLVLGGLIWKNAHDLASAKSWRVGITGYDPRDLLYGHYLSFRFAWGLSPEQRACPVGQGCCLCLDSQRDSLTPLTSLKSCRTAGSCASMLSWTNPEGAQRYFIPESAAPQLNTLLANRRFNLSVDLNITPSGRQILGDLYIDGVEWGDYLRQHPDAGRPERAREREEHKWRMKIAGAAVYGDYLVFRLDWGAPLTRNACPKENSCCALCLSATAGSSQPTVRYRSCGEQDQCLETLVWPGPHLVPHADRGFDPNGPQKYPMSTDEAEQLASLLSGAPKDISIDVTTHGAGGPPAFGDLYIDGVEWRDWRRQHPGDRNPAGGPDGDNK